MPLVEAATANEFIFAFEGNCPANAMTAVEAVNPFLHGDFALSQFGEGVDEVVFGYFFVGEGLEYGRRVTGAVLPQNEPFRLQNWEFRTWFHHQIVRQVYCKF